MARSRSNVERIRRPLTIRHVIRAALVLAGVVAGVAVAWAITPAGDLLAFDTALVRGALLGAVVGFGVAALVPLRDTPPPVVRPRPSGFDPLRTELEAERARLEAERVRSAPEDPTEGPPPTSNGADTASPV
jgi:hypothetical protein